MDETEFEFRAEEVDILADLDRLRPARYESLDWTTPIVDRLQTHYVSDPERLEEMAMQHARSIVKSHETKAVRTANRVMDKTVHGGALPMDFADCRHLPFAVGDGYVRLDALTALDLRRWADDKQATAERNASTELRRCETARAVADLIESGGYTTLGDLPIQVDLGVAS